MDIAEPLFQHALASARAIGDQWCIGFCLYGLALTRLYTGHYEQARRDVQEAHLLLTELRDRRGLVRVYSALGLLEDKHGTRAQAWAAHYEALSLAREIGEPWSVAINASALAGWIAKHADAAVGVRLMSAAENFRASFKGQLPRAFDKDMEQAMSIARAKLGTHAFKAAWAEGRTMSFERASAQIEHAAAQMQSAHLPRDPTGLTAREREVLGFVAAGLTDAQIAERLVVSIRTVHTHVSNVLGKLGVKSRVGAARYAVEHGLAESV